MQERLKELRAKTGLSQKAISELLDVPLRTWEGWETRRTPPDHVISLIEYKLKNEKLIE